VLTPVNNKLTWRTQQEAHIANGKIAEGWGNCDRLGMLEQIGSCRQPSLVKST
jgi:hypothetical protein